jgi:outer membrane protein TolC
MRRVLWIFALAGCAEINAARDAQKPESAAPGERTVTAKELGIASLTFDGGLEIALTHNPQIATSKARVDGARARVHQNLAGFWPSISASSSIKGSQTEGADMDDTLSGSLSLSQLVFDFGKTSATARQSAENLLAAELDLVTAANDVAFDYRQAFFNVLKQQELVVVNQETVRQFEKRLEQVKGFVEVGTRARYDLTKAQVDLGNAQLNLVRAQTALRVARATLNDVLGLAEDASFTLVKPDLADGEPAFDRSKHPRLQALAFREKAASAAIDAAIADLFPSISFSSSLSFTGSLTPVAWSGTLGPAINWLLFGGWTKTEAVKERVAGLREARASRADAEQQVFLQISQANAAVQDARERLKITELTVKQATENLDLVQGRFAVGRASSVELTDAQVALANARGERVQAEFDLQIALASLKRAVGTR